MNKTIFFFVLNFEENYEGVFDKEFKFFMIKLIVDFQIIFFKLLLLITNIIQNQ